MSRKLERKFQRQKYKKAQKQAEKEMAQKLELFDKLSDKCLACEQPFDKKDREQVFSWHVVVRRDEGVVNLYCPDCWKKAIEVIEGFKNHLGNKNEGG